VSIEEILKELPRLTAEERSAIVRRLLELEEYDGQQFLHEAAAQMFQDIDKREKG